ncbi:MAG TPA: CHASE2 domain-containing protein [Candidatus Acidoferrales bacterium]|nr:CHASE2 domain-containing protein [Candidatus Acidoferrales bacterium]
MASEDQATGKGTAPPVGPSAQEQTNPPPLDFQRKRRRTILFDALVGVILAVALVGTREWFEKNTESGKWIEFSTYDIIESILASKPIPEKIPITIVDLSGLKTEGIQAAQKGDQATPRDKRLKDPLEKLVNLGAEGIAVDVDFSPQETYRTPDDPSFFQFCLDLWKHRHAPIYLGVWQRQALPRQLWLLDPSYEKLGVSILAPRLQTQNMVKCFQLHAQSECGPTLSEALAGELLKDTPPPSHFVARHPRLFQAVSTEELSKNVSVGTFPVDFSPLSNLRTSDHTIRSLELNELEANARLIEGHVVLVGDVRSPEPSDEFRVPGQLDQVPGVYVHACAIYTLTQAPLYIFTRATRWGVDLLLALLIILAVAGLRLYHNSRTTPEVAVTRVQGTLTIVVVVIVLLVSAVFVHRTRLLWDDFLLVMFTFLMHPSVEHYLKAMGQWLRRTAPGAWRNFILGAEKGQS